MSILRHSEQLGNFGISLHSRIVESLVTQIEDAIEMGLIRCSDPADDRPQLFSVFDFINVILGKKNPRDTWQTLTQSDPHTVAFSDSVKFDRADGKKANVTSPASDLVGLLYIAYMANSEFSVKLRASSAAYFAADRRSVVVPVIAEQPVAEPVTYLNGGLIPKPPDLSPYPRTLTELQQVTGIKTRNYIAQAIKRDFVAGVDYFCYYPEYYLTDDAFYWLVVSFRSSRGTDVKTLPETIPLNRGGFKVRNKRKNARLGCAMDSQD